ncbi:GNAT family N-acetyltransferase [Halomarina ordinaria]|uniref:GNAT family N-acetyltransferase n=1 Tax=Halomarina ordinaria TaxID=3033939 RepID=A0ABD5U9U5_9EURY|nr:GNAT family N-acetyltransferase [Halomarina sp. PSRA2]
MEHAVLGWPDEGPTLRLDHREYAYAGKFVTAATGKAAVLAEDAPVDQPSAREGYARGLLAVCSFNEDRTDPDTAWIRYVTTRRDRRGEGLGARLAAFTADRLRDRGYERVRIAVNNPYAYHALSKAGFGFTGRETGLAELVLEHPSDRGRYDEGLAVYAARDLTPEEAAFVEAKRAAGPPPVLPSG